MHHQGLRIALGAFCNSPAAQHFYVEAHEPFPSSRRLKLCLNYVLKLKSHPGNPIDFFVFQPKKASLYEKCPTKIQSLSLRVLPHLKRSKLDLGLIDDVPLPDTAPRTLPIPTVRFDLTS